MVSNVNMMMSNERGGDCEHNGDYEHSDSEYDGDSEHGELCVYHSDFTVFWLFIFRGLKSLFFLSLFCHYSAIFQLNS